MSNTLKTSEFDKLDYCSLEEVVDILDGQRKPIKQGDRISGNIPYYGATGVIDFVNDYIFDDDLVLVGEDGENIKSRVLPMAFKISGKSWVNNHAHVLKPHSINLDFLMQYLNIIDYTPYITGTAQPKLNQQSLRKIKILNLPLAEQQKIAEILSSVDAAIEKTEQVIAKTEEVKKGLMQQLLTKGIGHTEFKQTEIGEIPVSWEVNEIGTLIQVQGGYAFKSKDAVDSGVRWFKIANVSVGNIKWEDVSYLPTDYSEIYKDYLLKERDFVVALTRPILKNELKIAQINKSDIPALLNQRVGRIRYKKEVNPQFIYYVMTSKYYVDEINSRILGTDPPNVSPKQLESILIQIPSIEEQLEIVSILENVDTKIKREEDILFKLNKLKQGLMQQLLTGQVRVGSLC